jgi:chromate reductase
MSYNVAVLVGSLRRDSLSRRLARAMADLAFPALEMSEIEIGNLPLYNPDLDGEDAPAPWTEFRARIAHADAVLFVTPEYNRSVPGALKNALDVGSRPYGRNAFSGKPAGVVTLSQGALGGFGANHHLRQSLVVLNAPTMAQPELYLGGAGDMFGDDGSIGRDSTRRLLADFLTAFEAWVSQHAVELAGAHA